MENVELLKAMLVEINANMKTYQQNIWISNERIC
jgi:hypothetical protein